MLTMIGEVKIELFQQLILKTYDLSFECQFSKLKHLFSSSLIDLSNYVLRLVIFTGSKIVDF